jgi:hypothetical protein
MKKHYQQHVFWKGGSTPAAPNYEAQAVAQGKADLQAQREATQANRVNQTNPWGSLTWSQTPGAFDQSGYDTAMTDYNTKRAESNNILGKGGQAFMLGDNSLSMPTRDQFTGGSTWTQNVSLNPADQAKLDAQRGIESGLMDTATGMSSRVGDAYANPFSMAGAPEAGRTGFEVNKEYQDAIMSRLAPDLLRQRQRQEAQLIAQGVGGNTNSGAWDRAQSDLGRNETDASMQALMKGYDVANNEFDKSNIARQNWTNEQQMLRDRPMTELLNTLRGVIPASNPAFEGFAQQGVANAADLSGATGAKYAADMNSYNAKQQQAAQNQQAAAGIATTAMVLL